jgi:hypothetical protein
MYELTQNFEQTALRFSPIVLIVPGLLAVIVGLFIWLGGLGFRRVLAGVLGAVTGLIFGFFIIGNIIAGCISAAVASLTALILQRLFIAILAVSLTIVLTFFVFTGMFPEVIKATDEVPITTGKITADGVYVSVGYTPEVLKAYIADFGKMVKAAARHMPVSTWLIMAAVSVAALAAGLFSGRLTPALCCAVFGTMLIFAGMIMLLLYKGSVPISVIRNKPMFYTAVFGSMTAFGTVVQLLLCPRPEKSPKREKETESDTTAKKKHGWRTS